MIRPAKPKDSSLEFPVFYTHLDTADLQLQHLVDIAHGAITRNSVSLRRMHIGSLRTDLINEFYAETLPMTCLLVSHAPDKFPLEQELNAHVSVFSCSQARCRQCLHIWRLFSDSEIICFFSIPNPLVYLFQNAQQLEIHSN